MVLFHGGLRTMCLHGTIDVTRTYYSERPSAWSMMSLLWWQARWCWRTGNCFVSTRHNASSSFFELWQSNKSYLASSISKFVLWYLIFPLIILIIVDWKWENRNKFQKQSTCTKTNPKNQLLQIVSPKLSLRGFSFLLFTVYCKSAMIISKRENTESTVVEGKTYQSTPFSLSST